MASIRNAIKEDVKKTTQEMGDEEDADELGDSQPKEGTPMMNDEEEDDSGEWE